MIDLETLINEEEQLDAECRAASDRYLEQLRARVFPSPSPFGVDWERQRVIEAHSLLARWSLGRKKNGYELRQFQEETLRIFQVLLDTM